MRATLALAVAAIASTSCGPADTVRGYEAFEQHVAKNRVGMDADQWIEMQNMSDEWERVGLIFGYTDDADECAKAVAGLAKVNFARRYRCSAAN